MKKKLLLCIIISAVFSCKPEKFSYIWDPGFAAELDLDSIQNVQSLQLPLSTWEARGEKGMIASPSLLASRAGLQVLEAGGNAADALAAVQWALNVPKPPETKKV